MAKQTGVTNGLSIKQAQAYYRQIWQKALRDGLHPGDRLREEQSLLQLAQRHPDFEEMSRRGTAYFTFAPDGRGNHRFVLVDQDGVHHPFSTLAALRGVKQPLRLPLDSDEPFKDLR